MKNIICIEASKTQTIYHMKSIQYQHIVAQKCKPLNKWKNA